MKWENFIWEITILKGRQRISKYQQSICMCIWKRCLSDYNVLDYSNCISEVINWKQRKIKLATSKQRARISTNWSTQFILCLFFCKATKHKYGGIPSVLDKSLELKFSCVRNDRIHSCDHWVYAPNTDGFARRVSGSTVLWFSPLTYLTHTLISCARAVCTGGRCTKAWATSPIWSGTIAYY